MLPVGSHPILVPVLLVVICVNIGCTHIFGILDFCNTWSWSRHDISQSLAGPMFAKPMKRIDGLMDIIKTVGISGAFLTFPYKLIMSTQNFGFGW